MFVRGYGHPHLGNKKKLKERTVIIIAGKNFTVARVVKVTKGSAPKSQRHNERENKVYQNINVDSSMSHLNYHYKSPEGKSYNERFDELVEQKIISTRGLKEGATHFDEIIFDVNTRYFEDRGGYEFSKKFYQEAYEFVKEKYGEDKIISAVMHADELNEGVTAELEKPVYHYHLHVVAIPTVRKEILYTKRCKEVELRGTVKEVITQVSHSKMWESKPKLDEKGEPILSASGKPIIEKSYSKLQDDFYNHMVNAGFKDFERGERGSTAEHLSDLEYKTKKETERYKEVEKKLEISSEYAEKIGDVLIAIESTKDIGGKSFLGKYKVTEEELNTLREAAEVGIAAQAKLKEKDEEIKNRDWIIDDQASTISYLRKQNSALEEKLEEWKEKYNSLREKCEPYLVALKKFPEKAKEFVETIKEKIQEEKMQAAWKDAAGKVRTRFKSRDDMER